MNSGLGIDLRRDIGPTADGLQSVKGKTRKTNPIPADEKPYDFTVLSFHYCSALPSVQNKPNLPTAGRKIIARALALDNAARHGGDDAKQSQFRGTTYRAKQSQFPAGRGLGDRGDVSRVPLWASIMQNKANLRLAPCHDNA